MCTLFNLYVLCNASEIRFKISIFQDFDEKNKWKPWQKLYYTISNDYLIKVQILSCLIMECLAVCWMDASCEFHFLSNTNFKHLMKIS